METSIALSVEQYLPQVHIRHLEESDLLALEWDGEFSHFRRVYAETYQRAVEGLSVLWVAEIEGIGVVGQVFVQLICDRPELADGVSRAYFYSFRVRDPYRSMGIGSSLLHVLEEDLIDRGYRKVTLNVARDNLRAIALYERHGYSIVAEEPGNWSYMDQDGRWHHIVEPAWRMEKRLDRTGARF